MRFFSLLVAAVAIAIAAVVVLLRLHPDATSEPVNVVEVPTRIEGEVVLFATRFGRVVARAPAGHGGALHLHREAHELWMPLGSAEATYSRGESLVHATLSSEQLLYAPPYALQGFSDASAGLIAFVTAPEDDPETVRADDARLADSADGSVLPLITSSLLLDKLRVSVLTTAQRLGPFAQDAAIYVARGRGTLVGGRAIGARQLIKLPARDTIVLSPASPLTLLVFTPAATSVSAILRSGTKRYSQDDEELVIRDFFHDRRDGRFLDVGASHYQRNSTTFYLEEALGWSGVAIDALAEYAEDYRRFRPRTTFVNALVTDRARGPRTFYRAEGFPELSSVSRDLAVAQLHELADGGVVQARSVPTSTLDAVLAAQGVHELDLLSMDIEEHEPQALAGFDIDRFHPALVCIEAHPAVRDALWSYFHRHGYARQEQYLAWDQSNWYFARAAR